MHKLAIVGGTFDEAGGKASSIIALMASELGATCLNGGTLTQLEQFDVTIPDVLIWMPNVSNDVEKLLPTIKRRNARLLLVSSKRVVEKDYTPADVVGRLLATHSNLGVMITLDDIDRFRFRVLDPLGNLWSDTSNVSWLCHSLRRRLDTLLSITRVQSIQAGPVRCQMHNRGFVDVVKLLGTEFAKHLNAVNPNRLLGNAATRCSYGFPACRSEDKIFVSRRNVDKTTLDESDFVEVALAPDGVNTLVWGDHKPSVDAPIELRLFDAFPAINYLVHGHVYVDRALMTARPKLPCGALEEAKAICTLIDGDREYFRVNLRGHGCLIGAACWQDLYTNEFSARPCPEE